MADATKAIAAKGKDETFMADSTSNPSIWDSIIVGSFSLWNHVKFSINSLLQKCDSELIPGSNSHSFGDRPNANWDVFWDGESWESPSLPDKTRLPSSQRQTSTRDGVQKSA